MPETIAPSHLSISEEPPVASAALPFMPQLDGLRAFAVLFVLIQHFAPASNLLREARLGNFGVRLFFVLSGFLITGILLKCREYRERGSRPLFLLRQFYARRFLRILPAYYLLLLLLVLLGVTHTPGKSALPWVFLFLTNFYVGFHPGLHPYYFDHLWSLAVEEHFYLVWPWIVLFTPRRWLAAACWVMIALGPLSRILLILAVPHNEPWRSLTFFSVDPLGAGALLAMVVWPNHGEEGLHWLPSRGAIERFGLWVGVPLTFLLLAADVRDLAVRPTFLIRNLVFALSCLWLVSRAARGGKWSLGPLLEWAPVAWTGRISYGIYLYHFALPALLAPLVSRMRFYDALNRMDMPPSAERFWLMAPLSVAVAAISWYLLERPANGLKRYFSYRQPG